jgi:hypothetical protein
MDRLLTIAALGGVVFGWRHFANHLSERQKKALTQRKLEIWEDEGGAVPVHATRTAAQISPRHRPKLSPRGVDRG